MSDDRLILAIETAGARVGCAVGTAGGVLAAAHTDRGRRHAESLTPQIEFVLDQAGARAADLGLIAVDVGPGLFTGLRVGVMTARTMAALLGIDVVAVPSLDLVAHGARRLGPSLHVVLDARRGEVFHAPFEDDGAAMTARAAAAVATPEDVVDGLGDAASGAVLVGDGARAYATRFAGAGCVIGPEELDRPDPAGLVALAAARAAEAVAPALVAPAYLRRPDAVARWEQVS